MERILMAAVVGALVGAITSLIGYTRFKKLLKSCETTAGAPGSFEYKGKYYDANAYIQRRAEAFGQMKAKELLKMIKKAEKKLAKSKNPQFDAVELEALKYALTLAGNK